MSSTQDLHTLGEVPDHLKQATDDAAKAIKKRLDVKKSDAEADAEAGDPKAQEEYTFEFKWSDLTGRGWKGTFTNRVMSLVDRQAIGALQSEWQLAKPFDSIDPGVSAMNWMLAHMAVTLKSEAEWAKDMRQLYSYELIEALYKEVASHEATFHGRPTNQEAGEKDG